jgi:peroxin-6
MGSPVLLYNIFQDFPLPTATIRLHASPFGSHPAFPTASNVTLARIASPFSTDRNYQSHVLHSLRTHLDQAKRLVKQGDLIAIALDSTTLYKTNESTSKPDSVNLNEVEYQ